MNSQPSRCCVVCSRVAEQSAAAYLLFANPEGQRLYIQRWDKKLTRRRGAMTACQASHVIEIVALWVATGSLDFTFAKVTVAHDCQPSRSKRATGVSSGGVGRKYGSSYVGELDVDRSSLQLALATNPELLMDMLEELQEVLRSDEWAKPARLPLATEPARSASAA